jgi:inner membrane protein
MSSFLTHAIVASTAGLQGGLSVSRSRVVLCSMALAILPDIDAFFRFVGLSQVGWWGHRGLTHSLPFSAMTGLLVLLTFFKKVPRFSRSWWILWGLLFLAGASHGLIDALTDGGQGIALLAPFDSTRYTFIWQPLPLPAVGLEHVASSATLVWNEARLVWLPVGVVLLCAWRFRRVCSAQSVPTGAVVALACFSVVALCAFLKPDTTHLILRESISYRGIKSHEAATLSAEVERSFQLHQEESLLNELAIWTHLLDGTNPTYQYSVLPKDYMIFRESGTARGDFPIPLEYRFRIRSLASRPDTEDTAGVAFDLEVELKLPDKHAAVVKLMQTLIRDRLSLLFTSELDHAARTQGIQLLLKDWGDKTLQLLPTRVGEKP